MDWAGRLEALLGRDDGNILWWPMSLRAVLIFVVGLVVIRLFGRGAFGKHTALDIVLAIIVGSNLSRALTASAPLIPTLAATLTIAVMFWGFDHLAARSSLFSTIVKGEPVWIVRDGKVDRPAMKRLGLSQGDLEEAARQAGIRGVDEIHEAVFERNGKISTLRRA
jgi:uncharacterized membrane protein YcaP (DUF421 family)